MKSQTIKIAILSLALICLSVFLSTHVTATDKDYCQACGKEVSWQLLTEAAADATTLAEGHYRLSFAGGSCDWQEKTISGKVCIDANGMTVRGVHRIFQVSANGELSLQGEGLWIGGGFAADIANGDRTGALAIVHKGGKMNLYSGTLQTELYTPENVYGFNGGILFVQGQFYMYGGRIEGGVADNAGGNVFVQTGGEVWMYDGVITNGMKQEIYCKGSLYVEGKASPGVVRLLSPPNLTISGFYTGYLVAAPTEVTHGMVIGTAQNAKLGNEVYVSNGDNRFFVIVENDQLVISKYQPEMPETVASRYCEACGRYADFVELNESRGFPGKLLAGHYYLNFSQGSLEVPGMRMTLLDRVCLDLNGMTVIANGNLFNLDAKCTLNIMDTAGGGEISRNKTAVSGAIVKLADAAVCNLYSGSVVGAGQEDCCIEGPAGKVGLYGGTVKNGYVQCAEGELQVGKTFAGSAQLVYPKLYDGMALGQAEKGYTGELLISEDVAATRLCDGSLIVSEKNSAVILYSKDGSGRCYGDFGAAAEAFSQDAEKILLLQDISQPIETSKGLCVDLNGFDITGSISGDGILYCMDSATAIPEGNCGTVTAADNVRPVEAGMAGSAYSYLMTEQLGRRSFHCMTMGIRSMSFRAENAGVYFTGAFFGDEQLKQRVESFGVMLSVDGDPLDTDGVVCRTVFAQEQFNGGNTSCLVYGIMKETLGKEENNARAGTAIYARPYILLTDGQIVTGQCVFRSLQEQFSKSVEQWDSLNIKQKKALWGFYHQHVDVMSGGGWNIAKMNTLDKNQAKIDRTDYSVYQVPWEVDAVAQAKADGKIHYYFMASEGLLISGDSTRWGDACLVVLPDGQTMLIDSGPNAYAPVLLRNLQRLGITKLDTVIISHPHSDHHGGIFSEPALLYTGLLDKIPVGQIYWRGGYDPEGADCSYVPDAAAAYGIPCHVLERGDVLHFGDVRMDVVWPMAGDGDSIISNDLEINNQSVVFRLTYGEHSSLFTGDMYVKGVSGERMLLNRTDHSLLDADLMKVPHHGYDTSSSASLVQAVSPEVAVAMGYYEIPQLILDEYGEVGCTLLGDRNYGYVHIVAGADGFMTSETSRTAAIS